MRRCTGSSITPGQSSDGASDMTSRTSIHSYRGWPPGPGSEETYAASSTARSWDSTSIIHQRLHADILAVFLEQLGDVPHEGQVRLQVLGSPLVHRGHATVRLRTAAIVLEEQVLGHRDLLVSWATSAEALHLVSGAGRGFDMESHLAPRPSRSGNGEWDGEIGRIPWTAFRPDTRIPLWMSNRARRGLGVS
jgi:hypothetical protein